MASNCIFICPEFFNYKKIIECELSFRFDHVLSFPDRPECSSFYKALIKHNVFNYRKYYARKYSRFIFDLILDGINEVSTIFIIKGTCIDKCFLADVKKVNPNISIVIYSWDSVKNAPAFLALSQFADLIFSFDPEDCVKYSFSYMPLFFYKAMEENEHKLVKKYDFSFVGSYHSDRVAVLSRFLLNYPKANSFIRVFFQSRLQYLFYFSLDKNLRCMPTSWLTFDALSNTDIENVYRESMYIIDIHHPSQSGLTMRTWEALSSTASLYTTNLFTLLHDISRNVRFIDRSSGLELERSVVSDRIKAHQYLSKDINTPFDVEAWLNHILQNKRSREIL